MKNLRRAFVVFAFLGIPAVSLAQSTTPCQNPVGDAYAGTKHAGSVSKMFENGCMDSTIEQAKRDLAHRERCHAMRADEYKNARFSCATAGDYNRCMEIRFGKNHLTVQKSGCV